MDLVHYQVSTPATYLFHMSMLCESKNAKMLSCMHWRKRILKNEGGKMLVKMLAYLCSSAVFVHICVIFSVCVADSSWVPMLFLLLLQQLMHYNSLQRLTFEK